GASLKTYGCMSLHASPPSGSPWARSCTIFYWALVFAWSPFVGTFVARVSYGRTIREFVIGVLMVPPLLACVWHGIFGGAALSFDLAENAGIAQVVQENITFSLFRFLELFPATTLLSLLSMALI